MTTQPPRARRRRTRAAAVALATTLAVPVATVVPAVGMTPEVPLRFDLVPDAPVLISEIAAGGPGADSQANRDAKKNFIELTNYSDTAVDLSGWRIYRCGQVGSGYGPQVVIADGTVLQPGQQYTAAAEGSGYDADAFYETNLHPFGFGAFVQDADGNRQDAIGFYHADVENDCKAADGDWLQRGLQHRLDESHQRVGRTGDLEQDWVVAPRTVGAPNVEEWDVPRVDNGLRFSEMTNGSVDSTSDQYVEVTNYGTEPVDLSGYQLFRCGENGSQYLQIGAVADGTVLEPGDSWVAARQGGAHADEADETYGTGMHWREFGAMLLTADDEIVDRVGAYGNRNSPCTDGSPIPEKLNHFDSTVYQRTGDTGDNSADFVVTTARTPGVDEPGAEYPPAPTFGGFGDLRISEVAPGGPAGGNDEFVELANYGDEPVHLAGYSLYRCAGTGQPVLDDVQIEDLGDVTLAPGEVYLATDDGAPAELREAADGIYRTGLNQTDGYGVYVTDPDGALVDAFASYDVNEVRYTPCALGEEARNWTKDDEGESYTRAQFLGDNELDLVPAPRTPGQLADTEWVDPTVPEEGELDPVDMDTDHVPGTPQVRVDEPQVDVTTTDRDGSTLDVSLSAATELDTGAVVVRTGTSATPVPDALAGDDETLVTEGAPSLTATEGYPYLRFEVPVDGPAELVWTGTAEDRNELQALVWDPAAEGWTSVDTGQPSADGDLTLVAAVGSEHIVDGTAHVMVIDGPRTSGGVLDQVGVTDGAFVDPGHYDVAINHMTDTQFYAEGFRDVFRRMATWVVANADARKIGYNSHTGDIVENWLNGNNSPERADREFRAARDIMALINDAEIPNGVLPGNHDNMWGHSHDRYNEYFPVEMYQDKPWYGESFAEGDNAAHTDVFTAGGVDFLVVSLPYRPSLEMMDWASEQAAAHPEHNVVLATHAYLHTSGERDDIERRYTGNADEMWERVVAPNDNVFLVLGGHYHGVSTYYADPVTGERSPATPVGEDTVVVENVGAEGRTVVEMLADYQGYRSTLTEDPTHTRSDHLDRDTGFQRLLQLDLDAEMMAVNGYSPTLDSFEAWRYDEPAYRGDSARYTAADDEFVVGIDLIREHAVTTTGWTLLSASDEVATGTGAPEETVRLTLPQELGATVGYVTVTDADGNVVRSAPTALGAGEEGPQTPEEAFAELRERFDELVASGEIAGPIVNRLTAFLDQAERHLAAGRDRQAFAALDRFSTHLGDPKRPDTVTEEARAELDELVAVVKDLMDS